jgi:hypothetical protein
MKSMTYGYLTLRMMMTGTIDSTPRPKLLYLYGDAGIAILLKNLCLNM